MAKTKREKILKQLIELCSERLSELRRHDEEFTESYWPKTREIADRTGESIYVARNWLLKLCDDGLVIRRRTEGSKLTSWCVDPKKLELSHQ